MKRKIDKAMDLYYNNTKKFGVMPKNLNEYAELESLYLKILKGYCRHWLKLNFKTMKKFLLGITDQNWEKIHENEKEESMSAQDMLEDFRLEFAYVSDRFSHTRMLRLHWIWLVFSKKFFKKLNADKGLEFFDDDYVDYYDWIEKKWKQ